MEEIKERVKEGFMFLFLPRKEKICEAARRTPDVCDFLLIKDTGWGPPLTLFDLVHRYPRR